MCRTCAIALVCALLPACGGMAGSSVSRERGDAGSAGRDPATSAAASAAEPAPAPGPSPAEVAAGSSSAQGAAGPPRAGDLPGRAPPAEVARLVAKVDPARVIRDVERLASFGTRHTLSDVTSKTRGIGAARRFLAAELRAAGGRLQVSAERHRVPPDGRRIPRPVELVNVVATLPGTLPEASGRRVYVVGHYDSRASDPLDATTDAPGADDDASGVAVVLEAARVLADARLDATVVFLATAGEEQGLVGAKLHARQARELGWNVQAVLSNDIVGDPTGPHGRRHDRRVRVFSDGLPPKVDEPTVARLRAEGSAGEGPARQLARHLDTLARWHDLPVTPLLVWRRDRFLRGGDHTAFAAQGFAAVRLSEVEENYDRQHQDPRREGERVYGDDPAFVDATYLAGVARLNVAALVHLASAPSPPPGAHLVTERLEVDTTVAWRPSPEPDTAGYEVLWRPTTAPQWTDAKDVGDATEVTLPVSKDNFFFGVRAYDQDGYRSPVSFAGLARPEP